MSLLLQAWEAAALIGQQELGRHTHAARKAAQGCSGTEHSLGREGDYRDIAGFLWPPSACLGHLTAPGALMLIRGE